MGEFQHIYLTGYRGTGKTSVGKILSESLGHPLVDLDDEVESKAGMTIREIFADGGETAFRDLETTCLETVADQSECRKVVSLGGGAILRSENRELIANSGTCIWLSASPETIAERISTDATTGDRRPALTEMGQMDEIRQLLVQREPLYRDAANHRVDTTDKTIEQIADEIVTLLG